MKKRLIDKVLPTRSAMLLLSVLLVTNFVAAEFNCVFAASKTSNHSTTSKKSSSSTSKKAGLAKKAYSGKKTVSTCTKVKVKTSKGYHYKRVCSRQAPLIQQSPIDENALQSPGEQGAKSTPGRATLGRAYAVDGISFFHNGRRVLIADFPTDATGVSGELARQRLQQFLDQGELQIETLRVDATGVAASRVNIDGKDIRELLKPGFIASTARTAPAEPVRSSEQAAKVPEEKPLSAQAFPALQFSSPALAMQAEPVANDEIRK